MKANPDLQAAFLKAFSVHGEIKKSAELVNIGRQTHYDWMAGDEDYRAKFRALRYAVCQMIEDALVERLAFGWEEPVFQQGDKVGVKRKFDNSAAIAYLDRHDPDFIAGKKQNVDVTSNNEPIPAVQFVGVGEQLIALARSDPDYLEFQRQKMLAEDADAE